MAFFLPLILNLIYLSLEFNYENVLAAFNSSQRVVEQYIDQNDNTIDWIAYKKFVGEELTPIINEKAKDSAAILKSYWTNVRNGIFAASDAYSAAISEIYEWIGYGNIILPIYARQLRENHATLGKQTVINFLDRGISITNSSIRYFQKSIEHSQEVVKNIEDYADYLKNNKQHILNALTSEEGSDLRFGMSLTAVLSIFAGIVAAMPCMASGPAAFVCGFAAASAV